MMRQPFQHLPADVLDHKRLQLPLTWLSEEIHISMDLASQRMNLFADYARSLGLINQLRGIHTANGFTTPAIRPSKRD